MAQRCSDESVSDPSVVIFCNYHGMGLNKWRTCIVKTTSYLRSWRCTVKKVLQCRPIYDVSIVAPCFVLTSYNASIVIMPLGVCHWVCATGVCH